MEEEIEAEIKGGEELEVRNEGGRDEEEEEGHKSLNHNSLYYDFIQRYFTSYQTKTLYLHRHSNGYPLI